MLEAKKYTLSELKEVLIKESNDFKPVMGKNVAKDNSKNNSNATDDIIKQMTEYNKSAKANKQSNNNNVQKDYNKTTLDVEFDYEPSKGYKDRIKSQAKGFSSVSDEKNTSAKDNDSLEYEGNADFYKTIEDKNKKVSNSKELIKQAGLVAHNLPKDTFKIKSPFTENKTMKRLVFKNTIFLNEENVKKRIPEDYKIKDNNFYMKDSIGNEYMVECVKDNSCDYIHTNVTLVTVSPKMVNEEIERIKALTDYSSEKYLENEKSYKNDMAEDIKNFKNKLNETVNN